MTSRQALAELLGGYDAEQRTIRASIASLMWHMRGSLTRSEAWCLSHAERQDYLKFIEQQKKIVEKTGLPLL